MVSDVVSGLCGAFEPVGAFYTEASPSCRYGGHLSANGHAYTAVAPASAETGWESETLTHSRPSLHGAGQSPYGYVANGNEGLSDYVKEERMRMLEKEFGPKVSRKGKGKGEGEEDGEEEEEQEPEELVMGSVDSRGKLVTPGPKKRVAARWLQGLVALVAAACGIGGVFVSARLALICVSARIN